MKKFGVTAFGAAALAAAIGIAPAHAAPLPDPNGSMAISSAGATVDSGDISAGTTLVTLFGPYALGLFADPYTPAGGSPAANNFCGFGPMLSSCSGAHPPGYLHQGDVVTFSSGANPSFPVGNPASVPLGPPETVTITDAAGSVSFDFTSAFTQTPPGIHPTGPGPVGVGSFLVVLEGTFAGDTAGVYDPLSIGKQSASLSFICTQVGPSGAIGCGISIATPASIIPNPEPASLALIGSGLVGLALFRRRRKTA